MEEAKWQALMGNFKKHLIAERGLAPLTVRNYMTDIEPLYEYLRETRMADLSSVDHLFLRGYLAWLLRLGYVRSSVVRKLSTLRSFFKWLVREKLVASDATSLVSSPKREQRLPSFLSVADMDLLLEAPDTSKPVGIRDRALLELLYAAGLRVSEVVGLNLEDVNLDGQELRVMGKGSKVRVTLFGKEAKDTLTAYLSQVRPVWANRRSGEALLLNRYGRRLSQRSVQEKVRFYATKAGLMAGVHTHTLRHTFATHLLDGGADLRVVQELLGHSTPATTQLYTHVTQAQARSVYLSAHPRGRRGGKKRTEGVQT